MTIKFRTIGLIHSFSQFLSSQDSEYLHFFVSLCTVLSELKSNVSNEGRVTLLRNIYYALFDRRMNQTSSYHSTPVKDTKRGFFSRKPKGSSPVSIIVDDGTFQPTTETHHLIKFKPPSHSTRKEAKVIAESRLKKIKLKEAQSPKSSIGRSQSFSSQASVTSTKSGRSIRSWGSGVMKRMKSLRNKKSSKDKMKMVKHSCNAFEVNKDNAGQNNEFLGLDFLCSGFDVLCGSNADEDLIGKVIGPDPEELKDVNGKKKKKKLKR